MVLSYNISIMFENLSEKLQEIIQKTSGNAVLTEENMDETLREIRRSLLSADVNLKVVKSFITSIKDRAVGEKVLLSVNPSQQLVKIVNDELTSILGKTNTPLNLDSKPSVIMMLGLQGSGKTTTSAKLALKLKREGKKVLLVACDVYRPAAIDQLKALGKQIDVDVFSIDDSKDVIKIVEEAIKVAKLENYSVVILDTAGRLQIDNEMMSELLLIDKLYKIQEKLLVVDSMTGQEAVNVVLDFDAQLGITGTVLTKLDGDTRGGAALSVVYCSGKPIKLTGIGEKTDDLKEFYPDRMASRILGMGDIVSLVEKAQEVFNEKEAKELEKKIKKAEFSFNDFLKIKKQMQSFGSIGNLLSMLPIPNLNSEMKDLISHESEKQFKKIETFINSMTKEERENPDIINTSRKRRIAKGCGLPMQEVNTFISQFEQMRKMMKGVSGLSNKMKKNKGKFHPNLMKRYFK